VQAATRPSSDSVKGYGRTIALQIRVEPENGSTLTFACFPFGIGDGSALAVHFPLVLILRTLAISIACVATLFGMAAFGGAPVFSGAMAFGTDLAWEEEAFDEATLEPFCATGAFRTAALSPFGTIGATTFRPNTFARFPTSPAPASFLRFFAASLLASDPGSKQRPYDTLTCSKT
jgi:hypothetical protein